MSTIYLSLIIFYSAANNFSEFFWLVSIFSGLSWYYCTT